MFKSLISHIRNTLLGSVIFVTIVAGGAYYLQSSLILVKKYSPYTHWTAILFCLPVIAGISKRFAGIRYPSISSFLGALLSAAVLYPQYKTLWAVPPTITDIIIYICIVFGIGFIATQPLKTTFMMAFRLGRFSIPRFATGQKNLPSNGKGSKKTAKQSTSTQPVYSGHGNMIAMMELLIGVCSLGLSIISVFFLGHS